jgi:hypothetical protein
MNPARFLAFCLLTACVSACGADRFIVIGSADVPSTSGYVEIEDESSSGGTILVHMESLHPVDRVVPSARYYAVWLESRTASEAPIHAGNLRYNPDQRSGELRTKVPFHHLNVKITAEAGDKPAAPSEHLVAIQEVRLDD